MMRKLVYALVSLAGVFFVVFLSAILMLATRAGSRWLVYHVASQVPGNVSISRIEGNLLSGISFYDIEQKAGQQDLKIQNIEMDLKPMALLSGKVLLRNLNISGVNYITLEAKEISIKKGAPSSQYIHLPFSVGIEEARLDHLNFHLGAARYSIDYIQLAGKADKNGLRLTRFDARADGMTVNLQGSVSLRYPYPFKSNVNWELRRSKKVQAKGRSKISGDINVVKFSNKLNEPLDLDAQGEVKIIRNQNKKNGRAIYDLSLTSNFNGPGLPPTYIETHTRGDFTNLRVDSLIAHTLGGEVKAKGHFVLHPEPKGELEVKGTDIDPGSQWLDWPGRLAFNAKAEGEIDAGKPHIMLNKIKVEGRLLKQPFRMEGNLTFNGKALAIENLRIRSGKNQINLNGKIAENLNLHYVLDAPDPIKLWPNIRGHLQGSGDVTGTSSNPIGSLTLTGKDMSYGDYHLKDLKANLVLDSKDSHQSNGRFRLRNLRVAERSFSELTVNWTGDFRQHRIHVDFLSNPTRGELEFVDNCRQDSCELKVDKASFDIEKHGRWHLRVPITLLLSYWQLKPFTACWTHEKSSRCMQGSWNEQSDWKLDGDVNKLPLKNLIDLVKEVFKKEHLRWNKVARY